MADEKDNIKNEFRSAAEETAAVFGNTLASISAEYTRKLREEADNIDDLGKSLLRSFKNDLASLGRSSTALLDIQTKLLSGSLKQQDISKAIQNIDLKINKIRNDRNQLELEFGTLTKKQQEDYQRALAIAENQKKSIIEQGQALDDVNKKLGIAGTALNIAGGILKKISRNNPFEDIVSLAAAATAQIKLNNEELEDSANLTEERRKELEKQNKSLQSQTTIRGQITKKLQESLTTTNLLQVAGAAILRSALKLNKVQTDFRRLTGESADNFTSLNSQLISGIDSIKTLTSLTEQFGFNANNAFSQINVQEATELEALMGLSAQEAGQLAYFAQATGNNLNTVVTNINDTTDGALSVKKVLQDVGNVSQSIAITFGDNLELLGKTAAQARLLGLNLQQVDKIAEGLLAIEQSLTAEFEAEVIAGQQLNLERARYFALTNDLASLTEEIGRNEEVISIFAGNNRIAQEAIASSLNLSRDEVAKMVNDQRILGQMTAEEREQTRLDEKKRLSAQESIAKSVEKLTVALAGPIEAFASLASNATVLYTTLGLIATISLARTIGSLVTMGSTLAANAIAAGATSSALSLGLAVPAIIAGVALLGGSLAAMYAESKQQIKDGIAPSSKGPFTITDSFGATAITARGDSLAVSPNIKRDDRNSGTMLDYDKLAEAIAKGAEKGTSRATVVTNLDGDRVSTRLQPSLAVNTRRYSV